MEQGTTGGGPERPDRGALFEVRAQVEALLLVAETPLSVERLALVLEHDEALVARALELLRAEFCGEQRGIHLQEVGGGFQLRSNPRFGQLVLDLYEDRPARLTRAALEALAIVAYRQPVTRAQVEAVRGVDSSGVLRRLVELELIESVGRADDLGRPHLYGTTPRFLEFFGLSSLEELPMLAAEGSVEGLLGELTGAGAIEEEEEESEEEEEEQDPER